MAVAGVALNAAFDRPHVEKMIGGRVSVPWAAPWQTSRDAGWAVAKAGPWRRLGFELGPQGDWSG